MKRVICLITVSRFALIHSSVSFCTSVCIYCQARYLIVSSVSFYLIDYSITVSMSARMCVCMYARRVPSFVAVSRFA